MQLLLITDKSFQNCDYGKRMWLLLVINLCCFYINTSAQTNRSQASELLTAMRTDTLFLFVPSYEKKINALENLLHSETNKNKQLRLERQLADARYLENNSFRIIKDVMDSIYTFSHYTIVVPSAIKQFNECRFQARFGILESGAEALVIQNERGEPYAKPFPYYARKYPVSSWFGRKRQYPEIIEDMMVTLNRKLWRAFQKYD